MAQAGIRNARRALLKDLDREAAPAKVNNATNPSQPERRALPYHPRCGCSRTPMRCNLLAHFAETGLSATALDYTLKATTCRVFVIIFVVSLSGFSGRFVACGYGFGHGGIGVNGCPAFFMKIELWAVRSATTRRTLRGFNKARPAPTSGRGDFNSTRSMQHRSANNA
ncbi:MAG TPA: hypothetical protein VHT93_18280 [Pseudolabrys sp.]|nr:hypothetical protein [Pseudolabrys sp.]